MPARNIKSYLAAAAAAAAAGFAAAAPAAASASLAAAPAAASASSAAAPATALATGPGGHTGQAPMLDLHLTQHTPAMRDDPHGSFDDGTQPAVLCATAIEYGLIAAL